MGLLTSDSKKNGYATGVMCAMKKKLLSTSSNLSASADRILDQCFLLGGYLSYVTAVFYTAEVGKSTRKTSGADQ